jgi:hypothetical protein
MYCGDTLTFVDVPASFATDALVPRVGDFVNLYGVSTTGALAADGYEFLFWCDPSWAC